MSEERNVPAPTGDAYDALLADLRAIIASGRGRAAAAINAEIVAAYWQIGERIVREEQGGERRATYGGRLLARLGQALGVEFGRAFNERNLRYMRQFYQTYPNRNALRSTLGWTTYRVLLRLPDDRRAFYERMAATGRWSSRELEKQVNSMLYERIGLSRRPEELAASLPDPTRVPSTEDEAFRDPYLLDFLGLEDTFAEKDLEAALVRQIEAFLLALGTGFYFGGRQRRIDIGGEDYYIDLVFWHRYLNCQVFIDLKIGALAPADIAQMKLYLNWARRYDKRAGEADPIGLILCGSKDEQVIELLLADPTDSVDERIKVAQYLLLDNQEALRERLAQLSAVYEQAHGDDVGVDDKSDVASPDAPDVVGDDRDRPR